MPPPKHRKKPFSTKQKKEQLKAKREKKRTQEVDEFGNVARRKVVDPDPSDTVSDVRKVNQQPATKPDSKYDPNRYRLHFAKESQSEVDKGKDAACLPCESLPEEALEVNLEDVYQPGSVLDMPKRPVWDYRTSKASLEAREERYFKEYIDNILEQHRSTSLSFMELNLETWRQLWRVLEMGDIILVIADIRHPALHFPPAFYSYVTVELNKPLILVLNKIDLAPPPLVVAWRQYFRQKFPDLKIVCFTSFPRENPSESTSDPGKVFHKQRQKRAFSALGPKQLLEACEEIVKGKVDLQSWQEKIEGEIAGVETDHQVEICMEEVTEYNKSEEIRYKDGVLTLGFCGYPNVGKSSLMNGLMGKKVVSVSKTPGHTKHFQTIYLTPAVKMCDSPGLVFPSLVPKPLQILSGIYPIAQVREPYTSIKYLAQRLPLLSLLNIKHPQADRNHSDKDGTFSWSALDICDAWASKRGFLTAKAARNDLYRAANHILRLAVDGRLCLCTRPPGYSRDKELWESHEDVEEIVRFHTERKPLTSLDDLLGSGLYAEEDTDEEEEDDDEDEDEEEKLDQATVTLSNPYALLGDD